jgi:hypothetical protein
MFELTILALCLVAALGLIVLYRALGLVGRSLGNAKHKTK